MCAIILFHALKCGSPDADDEVLRWYVKTAPKNVMYDDEINDDADGNSYNFHDRVSRTAKRQRRAGVDSLREHENSETRSWFDAAVRGPRGCRYFSSQVTPM